MKQTPDINKPVFVQDYYKGLTYRGRLYEYNDLFPWQELGMSEQDFLMLYSVDRLYHNESLEADQKVGDRLAELSFKDLKTLVNLLNTSIKSKTTSTTEFNKLKIKQSTKEDRQRALVRAWLARNAWAAEAFYEVRDNLLETIEKRADIVAEVEETKE